MKIETKFEPNQEVYYIAEYLNKNGNSIKEVTTGIIERVVPTKDVNQYTFYWVDEHIYYEHQLFATREEAEAKLKEINNDN